MVVADVQFGFGLMYKYVGGRKTEGPGIGRRQALPDVKASGC
jgi:hypothetical protein